MPCKMVVNDVKSAGDARFGIPPRYEVTFHAEIPLAVNAYKQPCKRNLVLLMVLLCARVSDGHWSWVMSHWFFTNDP